MKTIKLIHPVSFMFAALLGLSAGACKDGEVNEMRVKNVCEQHCQAMEDCANAIYDECLTSCIESGNECDSGADADRALDQLDQCRNEECIDLAGCSVDAWLECKL
jgi:hypothetical protein